MLSIKEEKIVSLSYDRVQSFYFLFPFLFPVPFPKTLLEERKKKNTTWTGPNSPGSKLPFDPILSQITLSFLFFLPSPHPSLLHSPFFSLSLDNWHFDEL